MSLPYYVLPEDSDQWRYGIYLFVLLIVLFYTWRGYLEGKGIEENLIIYMKATAEQTRGVPIAQIIDPYTQQEKIERNKKMDRIGAILTVVSILALAGTLYLPSAYSRHIAENNTGNGVSASQSATSAPAYIVENGQAILYNWDGEIADGKLILPAEVDGYPVTGIGKLAFAGRSDFSSVEVPEGIVSIDSGAFKNCSKLQSIALPQSLQALGAEVFQNCGSLLECTIPDGVTEIRSHAFDSCKALRRVVLPKALSKVGEYAFSGCSALESVQMPQSMPDGKISQYAFESCRSLAAIRIPDGVDKISARAFYGCSALADVELPMTLKTIGSSAFRSCRSLEVIMIPSGCSVDEKAFKGSPTSIKRK